MSEDAEPLSRRLVNQQARVAAKARREAEARDDEAPPPPRGCLCASCKARDALDWHARYAPAAPRGRSKTEFRVDDPRFQFRI